MHYKKLKLYVVLMIGIGLKGLYAQETISASGGNVSGTGGSVSYSVGQVFYTTNTGTGGSISQGVQQPYEISVVTSIEEGKGISLQCSVYPNPAASFLIVHFEGEVKTNYKANLFDINGHLLSSRDIESNDTRIDMSNLAIATYLLKIVQTKNVASQREIKTFKIIKN